MMRQVVVSGIGAVTPIGLGGAGLYAGLRRERSAINLITRFDAAPFHSRVAGEVHDFDPTAYADAKRLRRLDRYSQFAIACVPNGARRRGPRSRRREPRRRRLLRRLGPRRRGVCRGAAPRVPLAGRPPHQAEPRTLRVLRRGLLQHRNRARPPRVEQRQLRQLLERHDRDRQRVSGGARRLRRGDACGGRRGAARTADVRRVRHHSRDVHAQRCAGTRLPAVRPRARWLRDGRGRRHPRPGGGRARAPPRGAAVRHRTRVRQLERRPPYDGAAAVGPAGGARDARRARRGRGSDPSRSTM